MSAALRIERPATAGLAAITDAVLASLHDELTLSPKPGLVCPDDRGSHRDMDVLTMMRSVASLRDGFDALVAAAARDATFDDLRRIGVATEAAMLRATVGVNTHRGAIFGLGMLAAAAGACIGAGLPITTVSMRGMLERRWGASLALHAPVRTHGALAKALHGSGGALAEARSGFPTVLDTLLPTLHRARADGLDARRARIHVLMTAIARVVDTNVLHRGGPDGLSFVQDEARRFLASGGVASCDWESCLRAIGQRFVARHLSPGGSADLLAATLFVDRLLAPA